MAPTHSRLPRLEAVPGADTRQSPIFALIRASVATGARTARCVPRSSWRSLVTVTTLGGSKLANRIAGESGARVIDRAVRHRLVQHPRHRRLAFYGLDKSTPQRRMAFLDRVESRIGELVR